MAFPNEHAAQIRKPGEGILRRENNKFGEGIHAIFSTVGDRDPELQRILFDKRKFSLPSSRAWLKANGHIALNVDAADKGCNLLTFDGESSGIGLDVISGIDEAGELPTQTFVKDLIQEGTYIHPVEGWTLEVDAARMDRWIAASREMEKNGVAAEVNKDHSFKADDSFGTLHDLFRKPNEDGTMTLFGQHTIIGQEGIDLAQKVPRVSVWIDPAYTDGMGRFYGEAIIHSSIVQQPVVPDQAGFVPIAASSGKKAMAASMRLSTNHGDTKMDLTKWLELLGLTGDAAAEVTDENLFDKIREHSVGLSTKIAEQDGKIVALTNDATALKASVAELTVKAASAAGTKAVEVDPDILDGMVELTEGKIDSLVGRGHIVPIAASMLKLAMTGTPAARPAMSLSRAANGGADPWSKLVLAALEENKPVDLTHKTGVQVLSRQTPDEDTSAKADEGTVKNMVSGANGQAEKVL